MNLIYKFDDLMLEVRHGYGAGLFSGQAEIEVLSGDGSDWLVKSITLDCSKWDDQAREWQVESFELDEGDFLRRPIWTELNDGSHKSAVEDFILRELQQAA